MPAEQKEKQWSPKVSGQPPPVVCTDRECGGPCAVALVGVWCCKCGKRVMS